MGQQGKRMTDQEKADRADSYHLSIGGVVLAEHLVNAHDRTELDPFSSWHKLHADLHGTAVQPDHKHKWRATGVVSLDGCEREYRCACGKYTTQYEPERKGG